MPDTATISGSSSAETSLPVSAQAADCTVPASFAAIAPPGVRILAVRGGPQEQRRIILARLPHPLTEPAARLADALRAAVTDAPAPR